MKRRVLAKLLAATVLVALPIALWLYIKTVCWLALLIPLAGDWALIAGAAVATAAYTLVIYKLLVALYYVVFLKVAYLKQGEKIGEFEGVPVYRVGGKRPDAFTVSGVRAIFVVGGLNPGEYILRHEYRHLEQGNAFRMAYIYLALYILAMAICHYAAPHLCYKCGGVYYMAILQATLAAGVFAIPYLWYKKLEVERDADIYGFGSVENAREAAQRLGRDITRPASRLRRLRGWLSDHPPRWVRASERYYDRRVSTIRLFLEDVFGR